MEETDKPTYIIARHDEDVEWSKDLPRFVVQKGEHVENKGRESSSYLWYIINNYEDLPDKMIFCQGNPFDHARDILEPREINTYVPYGAKTQCDRGGYPHHPGLDLTYYSEYFEIPEKEIVFYPGAQFGVTKEVIHNRPKNFYKAIYAVSMVKDKAPWELERLWGYIFQENMA